VDNQILKKKLKKKLKLNRGQLKNIALSVTAGLDVTVDKALDIRKGTIGKMTWMDVNTNFFKRKEKKQYSSVQKT